MADEVKETTETKADSGQPPAPIPPPPGIKAMMISMKQMDKYGLKTGEGLKDTIAYKLFPYSEVKAEIVELGFYSAFHEFNADLENYPNTEDILIVADVEEIYGENWYICLETAVRDEILARYASEEEEKRLAEEAAQAASESEEKRKKDEEEALANAVYEDKPMVSRRWKSSSENETIQSIHERGVHLNRPMISLTITRRRREFGGHCKFNDRDAEQSGLYEFRQHKDPNFECSRSTLEVSLQACPSWTASWLALERQQRADDNLGQPAPLGEPVEVAAPLPPGCTPPPPGSNMDSTPASEPLMRDASLLERRMQCVSTQTDFFRARNNWTQFEAAGQDGSELADGGSGLRAFLSNVGGICERVLQQNEVVDIFEDELANLGSDELTLGNKSENNMPELRTFTDLVYSKNKVLAGVDWHPVSKNTVAVSCVESQTFDERMELSGSARNAYTLLWNFSDLIHPQLVLQSPHETPLFQFNPSMPHLIAAGCSTGQVLLWDISGPLETLRRKAKERSAQSGATAAPPPAPTAAAAGAEEAKDGAAAGDAATAAGEDGGEGGAAAAAAAAAAGEDEEGKSEVIGGAGDDDGDTQLPPVAPMVVSSIDHSHRRPVSDLQWLSAKMEVNHRGEVSSGDSGVVQQFATIAGDGQVLIWDVRYKEQARRRMKGKELGGQAGAAGAGGAAAVEIVWNPLFKVTLTKLDGVGELGLCKFSLGGHKSLSALFVGTDEGEMALADWGGSEQPVTPAAGPGAGGSDGTEFVQWIARDHFRPTVSLVRSPFFSDVLLSVGEWSFNLWREGVRAPIFSSPLASSYLTCGRWSPTRPGVLLLAKFDGTLDVWDLQDQSHKPSFTVPVASSAVTSMSFRGARGAASGGVAAAGAAAGGALAQQLLGVGDGHGNLHILDIPRSLRRPLPNEEANMRAFFEREMGRVEASLRLGGSGLVSLHPSHAKKVKSAGAAGAGAAGGAAGDPGASASSAAAGGAGGGADGGVGGDADADRAAAERAAAKEEEEYRKLEARFRRELGISDLSEEESKELGLVRGNSRSRGGGGGLLGSLAEEKGL